MRVERFAWRTLWILAAAVVITHILGAGSPAELWGANFYSFLPRVTLAAGCTIVAAVMLIAVVRPAELDRTLLALPRPADAATRRTTLKAAIAVGVFFTAFWVFREGHTLLGDGNSLTNDLPRGQQFHPHEPLTYLIHHWFYQLTRGLFRVEGREPAEIAHATVGLSSALAGAIFVPVAWGLARELARALESDPADARVSTSRSVVTPVFLLLLAQGYVQLFFGYVENYTFNALVLGLYLLASLRHLRGVGTLAAPGLVLVLNLALDLSAVLMVPSFLFLLTRALATAGSRWPALRDLILMSGFATGMTALLASVQPGFNLASAAYWVILQALIGHGHHAESVAYGFSSVHLRDFLNEQMLIGPAASFLFVAGILSVAITRARLTAARVFLLAVGLVSLGGAWVTTDLSLGYPRDWDLFAPSGLAFTAAGLHFFLSSPWRGASVRRWLYLLSVVCLFHTVPWIAINESFDRSFARFKTLPLGLGRTEAVVGLHYLTQGDTAQAIPWFQRSLDANPANSISAYSLGKIGMKRGRYRWAARAFWTALQLRPDKEVFRLALVDAIIRGGGPPEWAKAHVDTLLMHNPREPTYWAAYGMVCLGLGERDSAASAFERARWLAPGDSTFSGLLHDLNQTDGYIRAVRDDWPVIVDR